MYLPKPFKRQFWFIKFYSSTKECRLLKSGTLDMTQNREIMDPSIHVFRGDRTCYPRNFEICLDSNGRIFTDGQTMP